MHGDQFTSGTASNAGRLTNVRLMCSSSSDDRQGTRALVIS